MIEIIIKKLKKLIEEQDLLVIALKDQKRNNS